MIEALVDEWDKGHAPVASLNARHDCPPSPILPSLLPSSDS